SEFLKPCFAIVSAWLISEGRSTPRFPGRVLAVGVFLVIALLLKAQPDVGMLAVITAVFFAQLYVAGLNVVMAGIGMAGFGGARGPSGNRTFSPACPSLACSPGSSSRLSSTGLRRCNSSQRKA